MMKRNKEQGNWGAGGLGGWGAGMLGSWDAGAGMLGLEAGFKAQGTQHPAPSTQYPVPSTQYLVPLFPFT